MKNGFTLIEVITVLILLAIIGLIIVPTINDSISKSREKSYDENVAIIIEASKKWVVKNDTKITNNQYILPVRVLIEENYINNTKDGKLKNPKKPNEFMEGCVKIKYDVTYHQYIHTYEENC